MTTNTRTQIKTTMRRRCTRCDAILSRARGDGARMCKPCRDAWLKTKNLPECIKRIKIKTTTGRTK